MFNTTDYRQSNDVLKATISAFQTNLHYNLGEKFRNHNHMRFANSFTILNNVKSTDKVIQVEINEFFQMVKNVIFKLSS